MYTLRHIPLNGPKEEGGQEGNTERGGKTLGGRKGGRRRRSPADTGNLGLSGDPIKGRPLYGCRGHY
ncbi:hypothetical protein E2C01_002652 [Portunus trituberculatus]|uniref:Uncharacterized protein n=1 Tax=Portunus trituberculatus TaxID=210409 RepID=A0A5B7CLT5_PORTR|nr:hypothetical protein [Portunus trituberculatus]